MEGRNQAVCIASNVEEQFSDTYYSINEKITELQDQYWDAHPCSEQKIFGRRSKSMCYHLEKTFTFEDQAIKHSRRKSTINEPLGGKGEAKIVNGIDSNDIPASYKTFGFKSHELIAIGTYVDKNIIPGFQYKVRKNLTEEYLFDGDALALENVGQGYGKRLTFEGHTLNNNKNYFWSDSHTHGFGFTFQAIRPNIVFRIMNLCRDLGRVIVNNPARSVDTEITTDVQNDGQIEKTVKVHFSGDVILHNSCLRQNVFYEDMDIRGTATVSRKDFYSKANISNIVLQNFIVDDCLLVLED